jgi:hypothetical protein
MAAAGAVALPPLAVLGAPVHASPLQAAVAALLGIAVAMAASPLSMRWLAPVSIVLAGTAAWLLAQASYPVVA